MVTEPQAQLKITIFTLYLSSYINANDKIETRKVHICVPPAEVLYRRRILYQHIMLNDSLF